MRAAVRELDEAAEAVRRAEWTIERRREAPDEGPAAVRQAELRRSCAPSAGSPSRPTRERAERTPPDRVAARRAMTRDQRAGRRRRARRRGARGSAGRGGRAPRAARGRARGRRGERREHRRRAARVRSARRPEIQTRLRTASEGVTGAEVRAQQLRDHAARGAAPSSTGWSRRSGFDADARRGAPLDEPLADERAPS